MNFKRNSRGSAGIYFEGRSDSEGEDDVVQGRPSHPEWDFCDRPPRWPATDYTETRPPDPWTSGPRSYSSEPVNCSSSLQEAKDLIHSVFKVIEESDKYAASLARRPYQDDYGSTSAEGYTLPSSADRLASKPVTDGHESESTLQSTARTTANMLREETSFTSNWSLRATPLPTSLAQEEAHSSSRIEENMEVSENYKPKKMYSTRQLNSQEQVKSAATMHNRRITSSRQQKHSHSSSSDQRYKTQCVHRQAPSRHERKNPKAARSKAGNTNSRNVEIAARAQGETKGREDRRNVSSLNFSSGARTKTFSKMKDVERIDPRSASPFKHSPGVSAINRKKTKQMDRKPLNNRSAFDHNTHVPSQRAEANRQEYDDSFFKDAVQFRQSASPPKIRQHRFDQEQRAGTFENPSDMYFHHKGHEVHNRNPSPEYQLTFEDYLNFNPQLRFFMENRVFTNIRRVFVSWRAVYIQLKRKGEMLMARALLHYEIKITRTVFGAWREVHYQFTRFLKNFHERKHKQVKRKHFSIWQRRAAKTKELLEEWNVRWTWRRWTNTFGAWKRFVALIKLDRKKAELQLQLKVEKENERRARRFERSWLLSHYFLAWVSGAKQSNIDRRMRIQHERRKNKINQFLAAAKEHSEPSKAEDPVPRAEEKSPQQEESPLDSLCYSVSTISDTASSHNQDHTTTQPLSSRSSKSSSSHRRMTPLRERKPSSARLHPENPLVVKMEKRAAERKRRRKELNAKYKESERLRKEQEAMKREEEAMKKLEEINHAVAQKKQEKINQKRMEQEARMKKKIHQEKLRIAALQYERSLLLYHGWLPWRNVLAEAWLKRTKAIRFHTGHLLKRVLDDWLLFIYNKRRLQHNILLRKVEKIATIHCQNLLVRVWKAWKKHSLVMKSKGRAVESQHAFSQLLSSWNSWARLFLISYPASCEKVIRAEQHFTVYSKKRCFRKLGQLVRYQQELRSLSYKRNETWSKVRCWLGEHKANRDTLI